TTRGVATAGRGRRRTPERRRGAGGRRRLRDGARRGRRLGGRGRGAGRGRLCHRPEGPTGRRSAGPAGDGDADSCTGSQEEDEAAAARRQAPQVHDESLTGRTFFRGVPTAFQRRRLRDPPGPTRRSCPPYRAPSPRGRSPTVLQHVPREGKTAGQAFEGDPAECYKPTLPGCARDRPAEDETPHMGPAMQRSRILWLCA